MGFVYTLLLAIFTILDFKNSKVFGQAPVFLSAYPTSYDIPDTFGTGVDVALVVASDATATTITMATNTYFQFTDNTDNTGTVTTHATTALSGGSGTAQTLTFVATNAATQTNSTTYTMNIVNTAPTLSDLPTTANVNEVVSAETVVYTVTCSDPTDTVSASLVSVTPSNSPNSEFFFVQLIPTTTNYGVYARSQTDTSQGVFTYNTQRSYDVNVQCTDTKTPVTGVLTVNLIPNEPPVINNLPYPTSQSVASTETSGFVVFTLNSTDNENDGVTYGFTCNPTGCPFNIVSIGATTAEVRTTVDLSTLTASSDFGYDLTITPSDAKNSGPTSILTVLITGINNAPTFINLNNTAVIDENSAVTTTIFTVSTNDEDVGDTVTLAITSDPNTGTSLFEVNSNDIRVLSALDYETLILTNLTYILTVLATDTKTTSTATLTVSVNDVNEAPTWSAASYTTNIADGAATGTPINVTGFGVNEPDINDTLTCTMLCSTVGYFSMSSTCNISVTSVYSLDAGLTSPVTCAVNGTDNGGNTATTSLTITIVDSNNYTPVFEETGYIFYISAYELSGVELGTVNATDADTGTFGQFTYSLDQSRLSGNFFSINGSGVVSTALNISTCGCSGSTLAIPVLATDTGGLVGTSTIYVTLTVTSTTTPTTTTERRIDFMEESRNTTWLALLLATAGVTAIITGYVLLNYVFNGTSNICKTRSKAAKKTINKPEATVNKPREQPIERSIERPKERAVERPRDQPRRPRVETIFEEPSTTQYRPTNDSYAPPKHLQRWRNEQFL